jgi:hypothetical protein
MVLSGGTEAGPSHATNEGAIDKLYHVDVVVAMRAPKVPRDRQRDMFVALTSSFETHQLAIEGQIDFKNAVMTAANAFILAETSSTEGFIETIKFASTGPFQAAPASLFLGTTGEERAAVIRRIHYRGARRVWTRS